MARAGTIAALNADYTRTAILKGLPKSTVIWRHVLRNALLPTISVIFTQLGYLIGGLVVVETLFNYRGIGALIFSAAKAKDFPMLEAGVLTVGVVYPISSIVADLLFVLLNPRLRSGVAGPMTDFAVAKADVAAPIPKRSTEWPARLVRSPTFLVGATIVLFWILCAIFGPYVVPYDPLADDILNSLLPPSVDHWLGTDQLGRDVFSRVIMGSRDILTVAPLATLLGTLAGTALGLLTGYFGGIVDQILGRIIDAFMAVPLIVVALLALVALGASSATVIFVIG